MQFRPSVVLIEVDGAYWKCCISSKNNDLRDSTKELSTDLRHHPEFGDHLFYIGVFRRQYLEQRYAGCFAAKRSEWWIGPFWRDIASLPETKEIVSLDMCAFGLKHPGGLTLPNGITEETKAEKMPTLPLKRQTSLGGNIVWTGRTLKECKGHRGQQHGLISGKVKVKNQWVRSRLAMTR